MTDPDDDTPTPQTQPPAAHPSQPAQSSATPTATSTADVPESSSSSEGNARARLPIAWLSVAIGLTIVVIATIAILAARKQSEASTTAPDTGPLAVGAVDQPGAAGKYCTTVMAALPTDLSGLSERTLVDPTAGVRAWGDPAVVLRCGIPDPEELTCSSALALYQINNVAWLVLSDGTTTTYIAVDRPVRVAVTFTSDGGTPQRTGPIQQLSDIISADLPPRATCSSGQVVPPDNG